MILGRTGSNPFFFFGGPSRLLLDTSRQPSFLTHPSREMSLISSKDFGHGIPSARRLCCPCAWSTDGNLNGSLPDLVSQGLALRSLDHDLLVCFVAKTYFIT